MLCVQNWAVVVLVHCVYYYTIVNFNMYVFIRMYVHTYMYYSYCMYMHYAHTYTHIYIQKHVALFVSHQESGGGSPRLLRNETKYLITQLE